MSKKLYVKLQTPTIELPITATDPSGASDKITVGFRREDPKVANRILDNYSEIADKYLRMLYGQPLDEKPTEDNLETVDYSKEAIGEVEQEIANLIFKSVIYIKGAKIAEIDDDTGEVTHVTINDTRKAKPNEGFWEDADGCLVALLDMYLSASPWKASFSSAYQKTLVNIDTSEAKRKN